MNSFGKVFEAFASRYDLSTIQPGEALMTNDPYHGGQHLNDFVLFTPIFAGPRLVAYSASIGHHIDVGGGAAGPNTRATEVIQEGLRIPLVKFDLERDLGSGMQASAAEFPDGVSEKRWLNRRDLDAATEDHPVMVVLGIHASILNTRAWKETGYWEPGNEANVRWKGDGTPRAGSFIHRDESGHPIGLATEVWDFRPGYSVEQYKTSMRRHFKDWFLSKGLTSITTIQDTAPNEFLALQELQREGGLPVRLRVYPVAPHGPGTTAR